MIYIAYLTKEIETKEQIKPEDFSQYGEFELNEILDLEGSHPDTVFDVIKDEEEFLYTTTFGNDRYIFCKPWLVVEGLLQDETLKATAFLDENNNVISYKNGLPSVIHNPDFDIALIRFDGVK